MVGGMKTIILDVTAGLREIHTKTSTKIGAGTGNTLHLTRMVTAEATHTRASMTTVTEMKMTSSPSHAAIAGETRTRTAMISMMATKTSLSLPYTAAAEGIHTRVVMVAVRSTGATQSLLDIVVLKEAHTRGIFTGMKGLLSAHNTADLHTEAEGIGTRSLSQSDRTPTLGTVMAATGTETLLCHWRPLSPQDAAKGLDHSRA